MPLESIQKRLAQKRTPFRVATPKPPLERQRFKIRLTVVLVLLATFFCTAIGRVWQLQILQHQHLSRLGLQQSQRTLDVRGKRGSVYDRNGVLLALSIESRSFYVHPSQVKHPKSLAKTLAPALNMSAQQLLKRIETKRPFSWLKRQSSPAETTAVQALNLPEVRSVQEYKRVHPAEELGGTLLGFTGTDHQGLAGLEYAYDFYLQGQTQHRVVHRDAIGRLVLSGRERPLRKGGDIRLSIDTTIQHYAEQALRTAVEKSEAEFAVAVVLHAPSSEVLAMAQYPPFNPNRSFSANNRYVNHALTSGFEPGSTMKTFTLAAALEEQSVGVEQMEYCENGLWKVHNAIIHDTAPHDWLSLEDMLRVSSNICVAKIGLRVRAQKFYQHLNRLGFGKRLGVYQDKFGRQLAGEAQGRLPKPQHWTPVDHIAIAFGHGLLASPLQMAAAMNTIANNGIWRLPRLVLEMRSGKGRVQPKKPKARRVFSVQTTQYLRQFLQAATSKQGTGFRAVPQGYSVAGKTGTTEVYDIQAKGYSKTRHLASFVGFAPIEKPELTVFVLVSEPKHARVRFGGQAPAQAFRSILRQSLPLLGVWPTP